MFKNLFINNIYNCFKMKNEYRIIDNPELNRSVNTNHLSKLSSGMKLKINNKKINSYNNTDIEKFMLEKEHAKQKRIVKDPSILDVANRKIETEKETNRNALENDLMCDQYQKIEEELNIIKDLQNLENNFQNEQKCKVLFLKLKIVEFSIALFCIICNTLLKLAISSGIFYHHFKTYFSKDVNLNQDFVQKGVFVSIIMVSITTVLHCILTVIR